MLYSQYPPPSASNGYNVVKEPIRAFDSVGVSALYSVYFLSFLIYKMGLEMFILCVLYLWPADLNDSRGPSKHPYKGVMKIK